MCQSIPSLERNPSSHPETKIWSWFCQTDLKILILLLILSTPHTQKIQLEKEHDPVAIVADKALVKLFNKTTIMQLMQNKPLLTLGTCNTLKTQEKAPRQDLKNWKTKRVRNPMSVSQGLPTTGGDCRITLLHWCLPRDLTETGNIQARFFLLRKPP